MRNDHHDTCSHHPIATAEAYHGYRPGEQM
jgi:hypothetical protein